ncbi:MAG: tRNA lysidine(34) synthetase TilS, partial [bacterium]
LYVRNRRQGDWFYPQGVGGRKKLSDFFIDSKIPRHKRDRVLIVTNASNDVVWVAGLRVDARFIIRAGTERKLFIQVLKPNLEQV